MNFEEMMQRAVNAEAKAGLKSSTMVRNPNVRCLRSHRPSHNTSFKGVDPGSKNFSRSKEPKPKNPKPAPSHDNAAEPAKKEDRKEKKKRFWN